MKAKQLAKLLLKHPEDEVVFSSDAEGNGFRTFGSFSLSIFVEREDAVYIRELKASDLAAVQLGMF